MAVDSLWSSVVLLCPFSESLLDVKQHSISAFGGAALSSAVGTPFGAGNAAYFDGTDDYLSLPGNDFNFPTVLTIEAWIRPAVLTGHRAFYAGEASRLAFYMNGTALELGVWGIAGIVAKPSAITTANVWHHVAAVLDGSAAKLYLDGTQVSSVAYSSAIVAPTTLMIGKDAAGGYFSGYIGPMRVTASARTPSLPSSPFPRPTISGYVYDASVAPVAKTILVRDRSTQSYMGGANSDPISGRYTFYPTNFGEYQVMLIDDLVDPHDDECAFNLDPTTSGGIISTENARNRPLVFLGNATVGPDGLSIVLDGSGDAIQATRAGYVIGTEDFSLEIEFMPIAGSNGASYARILQIGPNATAGSLVICCAGSTNPMQIETLFHDTAYRQLGGPNTTTLANNTWHRLQLRRVNGVFITTINDTTWRTSAVTAYNITSDMISIGANTGNTENFYGKIGRVRLSRGPRRAAAAVPSGNFLRMPADGSSGENAIIYDRIVPGG